MPPLPRTPRTRSADPARTGHGDVADCSSRSPVSSRDAQGAHRRRGDRRRRSHRPRPRRVGTHRAARRHGRHRDRRARPRDRRLHRRRRPDHRDSRTRRHGRRHDAPRARRGAVRRRRRHPRAGRAQGRRLAAVGDEPVGLWRARDAGRAPNWCGRRPASRCRRRGSARRSLASFADDDPLGAASRPGAALGAARADGLAAANLETPRRSSASYKLLGNMRWHEADSGATVPWYRNTLTPSPLDTGNSDSGDRRRRSAPGPSPPGASISLAYGGTRHVPASSLLSCGAPPVAGGGLITYEDPDDDITTSGVIADRRRLLEWRHAGPSTARRSRKITYGFVIFTDQGGDAAAGAVAVPGARHRARGRPCDRPRPHADRWHGRQRHEQHHVSVVLPVRRRRCRRRSGRTIWQGLQFIYPTDAGWRARARTT